MAMLLFMPFIRASKNWNKQTKTPNFELFTTKEWTIRNLDDIYIDILQFLSKQINEVILKIDKLHQTGKYYKVVVITLKKGKYNDVQNKYQAFIEKSGNKLKLVTLKQINATMTLKNQDNTNTPKVDEYLKKIKVDTEVKLDKSPELSEYIGHEFTEFDLNKKVKDLNEVKLRDKSVSRKGESWDTYGVEYEKCLGNAFECKISDYRFRSPDYQPSKTNDWLFESQRNITEVSH
jgi:hypothetical protein